ncbi:hypothetical protein Rhal01_00188 [Rubritalea halochordaticola]|uniref:HMA domain-containing protein n=1 Tax=Rubritalea halochordaticola TaxID=714537 RepID=A0ABP9UUB9_9BACT
MMNYKTTLLAATGFMALTGFSFADCKDGSCKKKKCDTTKVSKTECDKEACDTEGVKFVVTGMTCGGCSKKVSTELAKIEGVEVKKVCHKSGNAIVKYDETKVKRETIVAAIEKSGFKVKK